jgi:Fe-S cluster assembly iron-binding protein IscA
MNVQQFNEIKQLLKSWNSIKKSLKNLENSNNDDIESATHSISELIEEQFVSLKNLYAKAKQELIEHGYQVRFCYVQGNLDFYQDDMVLDSSDFKCLICHKSVPAIKGIRIEVKKDYTLNSNSLVNISIHILSDQIIDKSLVIGHGDSEELAWDMAIQDFLENSV